MPRRNSAQSIGALRTAPGYQPNLVIRWVTEEGTQRVKDFSIFSAAGPAIAELVDAVNRRKHKFKASTFKGDVDYLYRFCRALLAGSPAEPFRLDDINVDVVLSFIHTQRPKCKTQFLSRLLRIINEAREFRGGVALTIPFSKRPETFAATPTETISDDHLDRILQAARADAQRIWSDFDRVRSPDASATMKEVFAHAQRCGGLIPIHGDALFDAFEERYIYRAGHTARMEWHRWLYATNESLLPFIILIAYGLAGNVHAVFDLKRNCMSETVDVVRGPRAVVKLVKGRSKREIAYGFRDAGQFSVPALIRRVQAMTDPLVSLARPEDRGALFLTLSIGGGQTKAAVRRLWPRSLQQRLQGFRTRHGLAPFAFEMLRTTRINRIYTKTGNILMANKIARHKALTTTVDYLNHQQAHIADQTVIADAQREIASGGYKAKPIALRHPKRAAPAHSNERDCENPYAPPKATNVGRTGLCEDWLFPLNDPGLIIPDDPMFLAALLRDRDELLEAKLRINSERYNFLYAPKLEIIDSDILPRFSAQLLAQARVLIPTLPSARKIS